MANSCNLGLRLRLLRNAAGIKARHAHSYTQTWNGSDYSKNLVVDEKDHPYTGTNYAWVRSRALGGKTNIWGRLALRLSDYDFKAASFDGYGEDWPISYADLKPYYDRVDQLIGVMGTMENLPQLPDGIFQKAQPMLCGERILKTGVEKTGRRLIPTRAGVTSEKGKLPLAVQKHRASCHPPTPRAPALPLP